MDQRCECRANTKTSGKIGENLHGIELSNDFWHLTQKSQTIKEKEKSR